MSHLVQAGDASADPTPTAPIGPRAAALLVIGAAAVLWLVMLPWSPPPTYDTQWQLLWGEQLSRGDLPDYGMGPTVHPLIVLIGGGLSVLSLGNDQVVDEAMRALTVLAFVSLILMCAVMAHRVAGAPAALVVAILVLTRPFIFGMTHISFHDVIFVPLCLGGFLAARAHRTGGALWLLAAAGLIRPEAWLFSIGLAALQWRRGSLRIAHVAAAVAAPALWACFDLVVASNPVYSFTNTSAAASGLGRDRGPVDALLLSPVRAGQLVGPEVAVLIAAGFAIAWHRRRRSAEARWLLTLAAITFGGYLVVNSLGTSILSRYLLLPVTVAMPLIAFLIVQLTAPNPAIPHRLRQLAGVAVAIGCATTAALGVRDVGALQSRSESEARETASVRAAVAPLAGCRTIRTNNFLVVAPVARELNRSPASFTLTSDGGSARPSRTEFMGSGNRSPASAEGIRVRSGCSR